MCAAKKTTSFGRFDAHDGSVGWVWRLFVAVRRGTGRGFFGGYIEVAVWALAEVADADVELGAQRLAALGLRGRRVEGDSEELLAGRKRTRLQLLSFSHCIGAAP